MSASSRLTKAFAHAPVLPLNSDTRYVCFSDCHRGCGNQGDNFLKNQHLYFAALQYYYQKGFTYLELGDGDELWENRSLPHIIEVHSNVFWILSRFYQEKRLLMLFGNHDMVKKNVRYVRKNCASYFCTDKQALTPLFPDLTYPEGCILENPCLGSILYLTHGHQADFFNSVLWPLSRTMVRYLWTPLERLGFQDPTSTAKNYKKKAKIEKRLTQWAKENHCILVCGHTHRPMLGNADSPYFNTGSCVHPRCITCLELEGCHLTLVKWAMQSHPDGSLYVAREMLADPICLLEIDKQTPDGRTP